MKHHRKICFYNTPLIWLKDKVNVGLNQTNMVLIAAIPGLFGLFGFIANAYTIFQFKPENLTLALLWFLFVYGLLISLLIISHQRTTLRMKRDRKTFNIIHKKIVEKIREYLTNKRNGEMSLEKIEDFIKEILNSFNDNYMRIVHRDSVSSSVKYLFDGQLHPIRVGDDWMNRDKEPEQSSKSPVYNSLSRTGVMRNYLYVKNIAKTDDYELQALGDEIDNLKARCKDKYTTFIALPIRASEMNIKNSKFTAQKELGILGFDLMEEYGFGNIDDYQLDILACLADSLAEPLIDLIEKKTIQPNENK